MQLRKKEIMSLLKNENVGIDIGTANVRIFVKGKWIVLSESYVVAVNRNAGGTLSGQGHFNFEK
jgi:actin-like ATPase involved in cell morphogenesis